MEKEIKEKEVQETTVDSTAAAEEKEAEIRKNDQRSLTLWLVAGAFLAYTGYQLCRGYILREEGSALGFFAAGAAFIGFGVFLVIKAVRGLAKEDKVKKARMHEEELQQKTEKMTISERARLAQTLEAGAEEDASDAEKPGSAQ